MASYYYIIRIMVMFKLFSKVEIFCQSLPKDSISYNNKSVNTLFDLVNVAEEVLYTAKQYAKITSTSTALPMDCAEISENGTYLKSGIYNIWPRNRVVKGPVAVYCDMDDDGGGWTVIQRRGNFDSPQDYFYREWASYKNGFGDLSKDFWIGNDNIYALTSQRASLVKFNLFDWEGNMTYATYDDFWIDDETHNYEMHITGFRGTAGDSMTFANGQPFTTKDKDNDKDNANCAVTFKGAWWYVACHGSNLNGLYLKGIHESYADGVEWSSFRGQHYSLKDTVIKVRPKDFRKKVDSAMTPM